MPQKASDKARRPNLGVALTICLLNAALVQSIPLRPKTVVRHRLHNKNAVFVDGKF